MLKLDKNSGILKFQDGTEIEWELDEYLPYDPAAYQHDEGIVVVTTSDTLYFISLGTGDVYAESDDEDEGLTRWVDARSPEIDKRIADFEIAMGVPVEERYLG